MRILVVGASGATGCLLVALLLSRGQAVTAIVRPTSQLPRNLRNHKNLTVIQASVLALSDDAMARYSNGCDAVVSCLGHNMSFKGIYGKPYRLVTDATRRLCNAIQSNKPESPVKFILMNTTGNSNRDIPERVSFGQSCVIGLIRLLLPPHVDNEQASDVLRIEIGQYNELIEWAAVRPDGLIDEDEISEYELHPSPIRSAIFDAGKTSRINVGHFIAELITNDELWQQWKGKMPVIYNKHSP